MNARNDDRETKRLMAMADASRERAEALANQLGELRGRPLLRWAERLDRRLRSLRTNPTTPVQAAKISTPIAANAPWTITIAAPSAKVAPRWGDWWLANGLATALRARGTAVAAVRTQTDPEPSGTGVHLNIRGLTPVVRPARHAQILWVISHPEAITIAECDAADLVFVASEPFARWLATRTSTPVRVLLQATDAEHFRPGPKQPDFTHDITVVAKTRDQFRPAVATAIEAGLRPAVYGSGWEKFIDASLIRSQHVPNPALPEVYRSARLVLNDHWDTMRLWGFVSNRIFDVSACGTPVATDSMPEIDELFGGAVAAWTDADSLLAITELSDQRLQQMANEARTVTIEHHTFANRAQTLVDAAVEAGVVAGAPGASR